MIVLHPPIIRSATVWLFLVFPLFLSGQSAAPNILCSAGDRNFDAEFRNGVKVHVGAARNGGLALRACAANLGWEKQELLVAEGASQIDLDAFGVDLGDGIPAAAFQIKKSDASCCMDYAIYSLQKPPRLLRNITGGEFFTASDMDLDGSVEIWTDDAAAVDGFENLTLGELDSAPTVIFRFARGQLRDVSAEFQPYFDNQIGDVHSQIHARDLEDFKNSDGRLTAPTSAELRHRLRTVKVKVLEIVWAYLYSGRESEAWRSLNEMWPPSDVERIRAGLLKTRELGIHREADETSSGPSSRKKKHAQVFDAFTESGPENKLEVVPPEAILLQRPSLSEQTQSESELLLELVVDEAGKVRSAKLIGSSSDRELIRAALTWKFIPAFKDDRAVASRLRIAVSPKQ